MKLRKRKIIFEIKKFLKDQEIIVLHGARQVGKTSIIHFLIENILFEKVPRENLVYFDLEDFDLVDLLNSGVEKTVNHLRGLGCDFDKRIYLFIDEIQYLENPSSFLKLFHDKHKDRIKLVVSGSSSFEMKSKFKDSLVGRTVNFEIFPLDFEEFLQFKEEKIKLNTKISDILEKKLKNLYKEFVLFGGYPAIVLEKSIDKKEVKLKQIINTYIRKDIRDLADIRNINKFNDLLRLLANQTGSLLNVSEISNSLGISQVTVEEYLFILENTYVIKRVAPFHKNVRSELVKMPKIFLEDTGIANILSNKTFSKVLDGNLFETSVFCQLRKNMDMENIYYWRTNKGQEVDFVIEKGGMRAVEVKLKYVNKKMKNLLYFGDKYKKSDLMCIVLEKDKSQIKKDIKQFYPWEKINKMC
jgi:predicted AAA+ superfamily ATPase